MDDNGEVYELLGAEPETQPSVNNPSSQEIAKSPSKEISTGQAFLQSAAASVIPTAAGLAAAGGILNAPGELIRVGFYIIYLIALIISLLQFIKDLIDLIIQPVKYHKGMYYRTLCEKAASHFGFNFSSTILQNHVYYKELFHLPKKFVSPKDPNDNKILGFLQPDPVQTGYYDGTFGQLLRELKEAFNAKVVIVGNTLLLERIDYQIGTSAYIIPPERIDQKGYNASECVANYVIKFTTDQGDNNTVRQYKGTIVQAQLQPQISSTDPKLNQLKGLKQVVLPVALGRHKKKLTEIETLVAFSLTVIEGILNICVDITNAAIDAVNVPVVIV
jgi:hypothetical protein